MVNDDKTTKGGARQLVPAMMIVLAATLLPPAFFSCSTIECPIKNKVYCVYRNYNGEQPDSLLDTLSVWTKRKNGTDTLLLNQVAGRSTYHLPISYECPEDTLFFYVAGTDNVHTLDTVWVKKEDIPHFESVDCNPSFFHHLDGVRYTRHRIDSISINHAQVNFETTNEHFHIWFKGSN